MCGIADERIRQLLAEATLTFDAALKITQAFESAEANAKVLRSNAATAAMAEVHATYHDPESKRHHPGLRCHRCGECHAADRCRFRNAVCHYCGKKGHIARVCRTRENSKGGRPRKMQRNQRPQPQKTNTVVDAPSEETQNVVEVEYPIFHTSASKRAPLVATLKVNDTKLVMQVDTGAALSLISESMYRSLWSSRTAPSLQKASVELRTYSGEKLRVCGRISV